MDSCQLPYRFSQQWGHGTTISWESQVHMHRRAVQTCGFRPIKTNEPNDMVCILLNVKVNWAVHRNSSRCCVHTHCPRLQAGCGQGVGDSEPGICTTRTLRLTCLYDVMCCYTRCCNWVCCVGANAVCGSPLGGVYVRFAGIKRARGTPSGGG